jgi:hypothetical protein
MYTGSAQIYKHRDGEMGPVSGQGSCGGDLLSLAVILHTAGPGVAEYSSKQVRRHIVKRWSFSTLVRAPRLFFSSCSASVDLSCL